MDVVQSLIPAVMPLLGAAKSMMGQAGAGGTGRVSGTGGAGAA
jgi:hypothetical protein